MSVFYKCAFIAVATSLAACGSTNEEIVEDVKLENAVAEPITYEKFGDYVEQIAYDSNEKVIPLNPSDISEAKASYTGAMYINASKGFVGDSVVSTTDMLGAVNLNASFDENGADISGTASKFKLYEIDKYYNDGEGRIIEEASFDGSLSINGVISDVDLQDPNFEPNTLNIEGMLDGTWDGQSKSTFFVEVKGDLPTHFVRDVNDADMMIGTGTLNVRSDVEFIAGDETEFIGGVETPVSQPSDAFFVATKN